jgi:CheY-like chemotaxis protein
MPGTILILEDHPEQAGLLSRILRVRLKMEPIVVEYGKDALRIARQHLPDMLLLDLMLADLNGFDVCRQLRLERTTMLLPVVMLTALNDIQHRVHGFRVGANAYVTKPYGVDELFEAIEMARNWRARMEREPRAGEIAVHPRDEINLLKELNDFLTHVCLATPLSGEQLTPLRQAVTEMALVATEWGIRHNVDHPLRLAYQVDHRAIRLTARSEAHAPGRGEGAQMRASTTILPCPTCNRRLRVPTDRGELALVCPICRTGWDWSPPKYETSRSGTKEATDYAQRPARVDMSTSLGNIYRRLKDDGVVDEVTYDEAGLLVHLTKSFAPQGEV